MISSLPRNEAGQTAKLDVKLGEIMAPGVRREREAREVYRCLDGERQEPLRHQVLHGRLLEDGSAEAAETRKVERTYQRKA